MCFPFGRNKDLTFNLHSIVTFFKASSHLVSFSPLSHWLWSFPSRSWSPHCKNEEIGCREIEWIGKIRQLLGGEKQNQKTMFVLPISLNWDIFPKTTTSFFFLNSSLSSYNFYHHQYMVPNCSISFFFFFSFSSQSLTHTFNIFPKQKVIFIYLFFLLFGFTQPLVSVLWVTPLDPKSPFCPLLLSGTEGVPPHLCSTWPEHLRAAPFQKSHF